LKDTVFAIELLYHCIEGKRNFLSLSLEISTEGILKSFEDSVPTSDNKLFAAAVIQWLTHHWPPPMLDEGMVGRIADIGTEFLDTNTRNRLVRWIGTLKENVRFEGEEATVDLKRFGRVLNKLSRLLKFADEASKRRKKKGRGEN
jgi:hypothetical protein